MNMPTFLLGLAPREFGGYLLHVPSLLAWARTKGMSLQAEPPIDDMEVVQVEALLCAIERPFHALTDDQAVELVAINPELKSRRLPDSAARWLLGAHAHNKWRKALRVATQARELVLLDPSGMPVRGSQR